MIPAILNKDPNWVRSNLLGKWAPPIVLSLAIVLLVTYQGISSYQSEIEDAALQAENLTFVLSNEFAQKLDGINRSLVFVADQIKPEAMLLGSNRRFEAQVSQLLAEQIKLNPLIETARIFNAEGQQIYSAEPSDESYNISDREYFKRSKERPESVYFSTSTILSRHTKKITVPIAKAILSADGSFLGGVVVTLPLSSLENEFKKIDLKEHGAVALRTIGDGELIYRYPEIPSQIGQKLSASPLQKALVDHDSGVLTSKSLTDGIVRIFAYRKLKPYPYFINVGLAQTDYLARWRRNMVFTVLGAVLLDVLVIFFFFRQRNAYELLSAKVNELKLSEEKANESANRLELALNIKEIGIWDWDLSHDRMHWDEQMFHIYGVSKEDLMRDYYGAWAKVIHPDDQAKVNEKLNAALEGRSDYRLHFRIIHPNGDVRHIDAAARVIRNVSGVPVQMIGVNVDITEHYLALESIEMGKKAAEEALRVKTEFINNMSHEIRTPMNGIIGLSTLALNQPLTPVLNDYLVDINSSATSLLEILNDILDFSKLEANKVVINTKPFQLEELLTTIHALFSASAHAKDLELVIHSDIDRSTVLVGDLFHIEQVLSNLVGNAIKFTEQGNVTLSVALLGIEGSNMHLRFSVKDTGIGISPESQKILFQSFTQVDGSLTRRFGGTGLGLAISSRLLELMGGKLTLASAEGEGSDFSFDLVFGADSTL